MISVVLLNHDLDSLTWGVLHIGLGRDVNINLVKSRLAVLPFCLPDPQYKHNGEQNPATKRWSQGLIGKVLASKLQNRPCLTSCNTWLSKRRCFVVWDNSVLLKMFLYRTENNSNDTCEDEDRQSWVCRFTKSWHAYRIFIFRYPRPDVFDERSFEELFYKRWLGGGDERQTKAYVVGANICVTNREQGVRLRHNGKQ